ncbi:MAG: ADP-ribosylation factor-like protein [Promethearchaeia archaeon]
MIKEKDNFNLEKCWDCTIENKNPKEFCIVTSIQKTRKILVLGLQNTGKTGMVKAMKSGTIQNVLDLKATQGRSITPILINDKTYYIWDHSGVLRSRIRWLNELEKLSGFDELLYVINPLPREKFIQSLEYLEDLIKNLYLKQLDHIYTTKPKLYIFLHKCDLCESLKRLEVYKKKLAEFLGDMLRSPLCHLFQTSLFNFKEEKLIQIKEREEFESFGRMLGYLYSEI